MAIRPPSWCKHAVPTSVGWCDPKTGELLKAVKIKKGHIDVFHNFNRTVEVQPADPIEMEPELPLEPAAAEEDIAIVEATFPEDEVVFEVEEAPEETSEYDDLEDMTKKELEELGREHGIELDRREKKATLIEKMKDILG